MERSIAAVGDTGIVVVDEAYGTLARTSFMPRLPEFPNMVVMRTLSKLGLAGIRLGYLSCDARLLANFEKVRPPYNVIVLTEVAADFALDNLHVLDQQAETLIAAREQLAADLNALPGVSVFPSAANFLLVKVPDATRACEKLLDLFSERERTYAHVIDLNATALQYVERFSNRAIATPEGDDARGMRVAAFKYRTRHPLLRSLELAFQAIEDDLILGRVLGVAAVLRMAGTSREVRPLRMNAGQGSIRNRIAILVHVPIELIELLDLFLRQHLAAIGLVAIVPFEDRAHPIIHADIEIRHHEHRCLQPLR